MALIPRLICAAAATCLLLWPSQVLAAEVLQVRSGNLLQIGDRNRNYSVQLACVVVDPADDAAAVDWIRKQLPRRSKVNLRPTGSADGVLIAHINHLDGQGNHDLGAELIESGLASNSGSC
ncbi:nuclease [Synechococcus sp. A10-1-5-1]|uniref:nuclease n=1 Tax=Synechococcus sp. A10-1-5-1 TaxID=2936507 RepID=UPI0035303570